MQQWQEANLDVSCPRKGLTSVNDTPTTYQVAYTAAVACTGHCWGIPLASEKPHSRCRLTSALKTAQGTVHVTGAPVEQPCKQRQDLQHFQCLFCQGSPFSLFPGACMPVMFVLYHFLLSSAAAQRSVNRRPLKPVSSVVMRRENAGHDDSSGASAVAHAAYTCNEIGYTSHIRMGR